MARVWLVMNRRDEGVIEHWVANRPLMLGGPKVKARVQTAEHLLLPRVVRRLCGLERVS